MSILDILKTGIEFANNDEAARAMLADFHDNRVGIQFDSENITLVVKDGVISLEPGMRDDCHAAIKLKTIDLCGAIDNSFDLLEIRERGEILKGEIADPNLPVHFMSTFPFFDAMVRLYEQDAAFKKQVDAVRDAL